MKIFDEQDNELQDFDKAKGYLREDRRLIAHHEAQEAVEEAGHYETIREYPETGGRDVEWVIDRPRVEAKDAWDEYEVILRYVLYSARELAEMEIFRLREKLKETDYIPQKAMDMVISCGSLQDLFAILEAVREEYSETLASRKAWREEINRLETVK